MTFNAALLTHETRRKSTMQVALPKLSFKTEHANTSLAGVSVHEDGGRSLLYQADAKDVVSERVAAIAALFDGPDHRSRGGGLETICGFMAGPRHVVLPAAPLACGDATR